MSWASLSRVSVAHVALVLVVVCGCHGSVEKLTLVPVTGKVTLGESLLTAGNVVFTREGPEPKVMARGLIDKNGTFELNTAGAAGAPPGRYKVTVFSGRPGAPIKSSSIPARYSSAEESPLEIQVVEHPSPGAYDLKLTKN